MLQVLLQVLLQLQASTDVKLSLPFETLSEGLVRVGP